MSGIEISIPEHLLMGLPALKSAIKSVFYQIRAKACDPQLIRAYVNAMGADDRDIDCLPAQKFVLQSLAGEQPQLYVFFWNGAMPILVEELLSTRCRYAFQLLQEHCRNEISCNTSMPY